MDGFVRLTLSFGMFAVMLLLINTVNTLVGKGSVLRQQFYHASKEEAADRHCNFNCKMIEAVPL